MTLFELLMSWKYTCFYSGRWEARIGVPGSKHIYLGLHDSGDEAAKAYDSALVSILFSNLITWNLFLGWKWLQLLNILSCLSSLFTKQRKYTWSALYRLILVYLPWWKSAWQASRKACLRFFTCRYLSRLLAALAHNERLLKQNLQKFKFWSSRTSAGQAEGQYSCNQFLSIRISPRALRLPSQATGAISNFLAMSCTPLVLSSISSGDLSKK